MKDIISTKLPQNIAAMYNKAITQSAIVTITKYDIILFIIYLYIYN